MPLFHSSCALALLHTSAPAVCFNRSPNVKPRCALAKTQTRFLAQRQQAVGVKFSAPAMKVAIGKYFCAQTPAAAKPPLGARRNRTVHPVTRLGLAHAL